MGDILLLTSGNKIKLWKTNGSNISLVDQPIVYGNGPTAICWSADNQYVAGCSSSSETIKINDQDSGREIIIAGDECLGKTCVSFDSSNDIFAGGRNGLIHVWDIKNKRLKDTFKGVSRCVTAIQHDYANSTFVAGYDNGNILIFRKMIGNFQSIPSSNNMNVSCLRFSRFHKNLLAASSANGSVYTFDMMSQSLMKLYSKQHSAPATSVAFSPFNENLMLSVGLDKRICFYDVKSPNVLNSFPCDEPLNCVDLHHNGYTAVVGTTSGRLLFYDIRKNWAPIITHAAHDSSVFSLRFEHKLNKNKSKPKTKKEMLITKAEAMLHNDSKDSSTSIGINSDIFSPAKFDDSGSPSLKQSFNKLTRDSLNSETSLSNARVSSMIFSPLASGPSSQQCDISTSSRIDNSFTQVLSDNPYSNSIIEDTQDKPAHDLLNPPTESNPLDIQATGMNKSIDISINKSIDMSINKFIQKLSEKVDDDHVGAAGVTNLSVDMLQMELLRKIVKDECGDYFEQIHKDILNFQVETNRNFNHHKQILDLLQQSVITEHQLQNEIKHLREENTLLKKHLNII